MRHEFYRGTENRPPLSNFIVFVDDKMQHDYQYHLVEPAGENFAPDFKPELTPVEMLNMGVFEGKYLNDCRNEFPAFWFENAHLSPKKADANQNFFHVRSRLPLSEWRRRGWILDPDPRGWFQWYCRYYYGRRLPKVDAIQINRWKSFRRHKAQIEKNCYIGDLNCRPRQRQALLQWAYDPFF